MFVVPGNHDCDRDEHEPSFLTEITSASALSSRWSQPRRRQRVFADKLAAYREFAARLNPALRVPTDQPGGGAGRAR